MSFIRRLLSFALVQLLIEAAILSLLISAVPLIFSSLPIPRLSYNGSSITATTLTACFAFAVLILGGIYLEHRSLNEIGLGGSRAWLNLLSGFFYAAILFSIIIGVMALNGWYRIASIASASDLPGILLPSLWLFFCAAALEELLFRGIIFRLLEHSFGSWIALVLSALVFGLSHLQSPHATLAGALAIAMSAGILAGLAYILTHNLWLIIGLHWGWNLFEATVFGIPTSGRSFAGIFHPFLTGPVLWTGGTFGPEAGLLVTIACLLIAIPLLIVTIRSKKYITPAWMRPAPAGSAQTPEARLTS
jgi:membrane protease YdiL (CAAX protease family)